MLFIGINPGLRSAQLGQHFASGTNRFWPALRAAGLVPAGFSSVDQERLPEFGLGITNLVSRTTARAAQLDDEELRLGAAHLLKRLNTWQPHVCAMLGITAYRIAFGRPKAVVGPQPLHSGRPRWWVLHNPSGLNAHARLSDHIAGLRAAALDAGLLVHGGHGAIPHDSAD